MASLEYTRYPTTWESKVVPPKLFLIYNYAKHQSLSIDKRQIFMLLDKISVLFSSRNNFEGTSFCIWTQNNYQNQYFSIDM